jgi:hypothetical protein
MRHTYLLTLLFWGCYCMIAQKGFENSVVSNGQGIRLVGNSFQKLSAHKYAATSSQTKDSLGTGYGRYSYGFLSSKLTYDPINKFSGIGYQLSVSRRMRRLISWNLNASYHHAYVKKEYGENLQFLNLSLDNIIDFKGSKGGQESVCRHVAFGSIGFGNSFRLNSMPDSVANAYNFLLNLGVGYRYKLASNWDLTFWTKFPFRLTRLHDDRLYDKYWDLTLLVSYIPSR